MFIVNVAKLIYPSDVLKIRKEINNYMRQSLNEKNIEYEILIKILVVGEDRRFYWHPGFDIIAILRAIRNNLFYHKNEGASTITQQLLRTILGDYKISYRRKIKEIVLSTMMERFMNKRNLAIFYLQKAYFGKNIYGYHSIADYLNISVANIGWMEAASVIARLKYPEADDYLTQSRINNRIQHLLTKVKNK